MRDICRKALDCLHARVQGVRHLLQRLSQIADLVVPAAQAGDEAALAAPVALPAAAAAAHPIRRLGQAPDGQRDGTCEVEREQDRHRESDAEHQQNVVPAIAYGPFDAVAVLGEHERAQHLTVALNGHRQGEDDAAIFAGSHPARRIAGEGGDNLGVVAGALAERFAVGRQSVIAGQPIDHGVVEIVDPADQTVARLQRRQFGDLDLPPRPHQQEGVGRQPAGAVEYPRAQRGAGHEEPHGLAGCVLQ